MQQFRSRLRHRWVPLCIVLLITVFQVLPGPRPVDDAYITFRYARHLANGQGFVYNIDQHVLGTTTPLFTLLLAALRVLLPGVDFPWLAILISAACDVMTIVLLRRLIIAFGQSPFVASIVALAYLLSPVRLGVALGGMETSLVVMLLVAASEAYVARRRVNQAALFSAFAVLARPDAILLPVMLALYEVFFRRRVPWKAGLIFAAVLTPWLVFAQIYFGSLLPTSITAKTQAYFLPSTSALTTLMDFVVLRVPLKDGVVPTATVGVGLFVLLTLYVLGVRSTVRAQPCAWPLVLYPFLYIVGLALGNPVIFAWYYPPLLIWLDTFVLLGIAALLGSKHFSWSRQVVWLAGVSMLLLIQWNGVLTKMQPPPVTLRQRENVYAQAASTLRDEIAPGSRVALPEIGVLGYALDRAYIIDTVGLVSPEAIPYLLRQRAPGQEFDYAISTEVMTALKPDYLIALEIFARPTLLQSPEFLEAYQLIKTFEASDFGSGGLLVFRRKS